MDAHSNLRLRDSLLAAAEIWAQRTGRSTGALASLVVNHGAALDRLRDPAARVTDATLERFAAFLGSGSNWPDGAVPHEANEFCHRVGFTSALPAAATGKTGEHSDAVPAREAGA